MPNTLQDLKKYRSSSNSVSDLRAYLSGDIGKDQWMLNKEPKQQTTAVEMMGQSIKNVQESKPLNIPAQQPLNILDGAEDLYKQNIQPLLKANSVSALSAARDSINMAPEERRKYTEELYKKPYGSFVAGMSDSTALGLLKKNDPEMYKVAQNSNPAAYTAGSVLGYLFPGTAAAKATAPLTRLATKKIGSELGKRVVEGAIAGSLVDTAEGAIARDKPMDLLKRVGRGALIGAGADTALYGAGKGISKLVGNLNTPKTDIPTDQPNKVGIPTSNTQPGQIPQAIGQERRLNDILRQKVEQMSPEDRYKELYSHPLTGIMNKRGYQEILNNPELRKPVQVSMDVDGLKWFNDNLGGHVAGDALLKAMGDSLKKSGIDDVFHLSGDEFAAQFRTSEEAHTVMKKVQDVLSNRTITIKKANGEVLKFKGGGFSYGLGDTPEIADEAMLAHKATREQQGFRPKRGERPPTLVELSERGSAGGINGDDIGYGRVEQPKINLQPNKLNQPQDLAKAESFSMQKTDVSELQKTRDTLQKRLSGLVNKQQSEIDKLSTTAKEYRNRTIRELEQELNDINLQLFSQMKNEPSSAIALGQQKTPQSKIVSSGTDEQLTPLQRLLGLKNKAYTRFIDTNYPFKSVGERPYTLATNSKNVGGTVDYIFKDALVDKSGNKIGESLENTIRKIPKGMQNDFWIYALQRHNIDRAGQGKHVFQDFTPDMSRSAVADIESKNPGWKKIADDVVNWIDKFSKEWLVDSGLSNSEKYSAMKEMYKSYIPTNREFTELEKDVSNSIGRKYTDLNSPVKKATGSDRNIIDPVENIMNMVNRTVRTARYNEVGQGLLNEIRKSPENLKSLAEIIPDTDGMFSNVDNIVTVLENGKPTYVKVNNKDLLDTLNDMYKVNPGDIERLAKKATGIFKGLITTKNPVFAVRNIARDIPTAYVNGSETNPIKFGTDLLKAGKDIVTNSKSAQQYRAVGGGGSNFFKSDNVAQSAKELMQGPGKVKRVGEAIEKFNNITESAPRLAEFKRVYEKTGDIQKALYASNDVTTNFSRGGDITKQLDAFIPYLNAGIQGLDKLARTVDPRNPKKALGTLIKGGVAVTAPTMFFHYINLGNENYKNLDNRTKDNYYLIPNGDKFIKIPKSRELGVLFGSLFERLARKSEGDQNAFKGFKDTVATNFSPSNPVENNIFAPATLNIATNKDFAGRKIVPDSMKNLSPKYQYDEKTTEIAKKIGEIANISPKQVDYIIRSYSGVIGQIGIPATTKGSYSKDPLKNILNPITSQFVSDPAYSNQAITDFYDNMDKLNQKAADKNFTEKIPSRKITTEEKARNQFNKVQEKITELNKKIKNTTNDEEKRKLRLQIVDIAKQANSKFN